MPAAVSSTPQQNNAIRRIDSVAGSVEQAIDNIVHINAPDQIIEINKMIAKNAKSAIYFRNSAREWVIEKYTKGIHKIQAIC